MRRILVGLVVAVSISSGCNGISLKQLGLVSAKATSAASNPPASFPSPSQSATASDSPEANPSESTDPTALPSPTPSPSPSPSPSPTISPTPIPTASPTVIPSPIVIPFHEIGSPVATDDLPWWKFSSEANDGSGKKLDFRFSYLTRAGSWISTDSANVSISGGVRIPGYQWSLGLSKDDSAYFYWFPYRNPIDTVALFGRVKLYISNVGPYYGIVVDRGLLAFAVQPSGKWAASYISDTIPFGTLDGTTTPW